MFVIMNLETQLYAKHTGEENSYPWEMVSDIDEATQYSSFEHANETAYWHLDHTEKWLMVSLVTGIVYDKDMPKRLPN